MSTQAGEGNPNRKKGGNVMTKCGKAVHVKDNTVASINRGAQKPKSEEQAQSAKQGAVKLPSQNEKGTASRSTFKFHARDSKRDARPPVVSGMALNHVGDGKTEKNSSNDVAASAGVSGRDKPRAGNGTEQKSVWDTVTEEAKQTIPDVNLGQIILPFGISEALQNHLDDCYPGFEFSAARGTPYHHPKSHVDRIMVTWQFMNGIPASEGNDFGVCVAEHEGNKYVKRRFNTHSENFTFAGAQSQFASLTQGSARSTRGEAYYVVSYNMFGFKPSLASWGMVYELASQTVTKRMLFAFVPTSFVITSTSKHEVTGKFVSDETLSVDVAGSKYVDSDNSWTSTPGAFDLGGRYLTWKVRPERCGCFSILEVQIEESMPLVVEQTALTLSEALNPANTKFGIVTGVTYNLAEVVKAVPGMLIVNHYDAGWVSLPTSLIDKLTTRAMRLGNISSDSTRTQLEIYAGSLTNNNPVHSVLATVVARKYASQLSLLGSINSNTYGDEELHANAADARKRFVVQEESWSESIWRHSKKAVKMLFAFLLIWMFYSLLIPAFGFQFDEAELARVTVAAGFPMYDLSASTASELPGKGFSLKAVGSDYRVIASDVSGLSVKEPPSPAPNAVHISEGNYVSHSVDMCLYYGVNCVAEVGEDLRDGTEIVLKGDVIDHERSPQSAFVGISVATEPHVYASTTKNEQIVLHNRAFARKGTPVAANVTEFVNWVKSNYLSIFNVREAFCVAADVPAWFAQLEPAKAKLYAQHDPSKPLNNGDFLRAAFVKKEHVMKNHELKPGRLVQGSSPAVNRMIGPWVWAFSNVLHVLWHPYHRVFYNGTASAELEGKRFDDISDYGCRWTDGDFSSFDSTQSAELLGLIHWVYKQFGAPEHVLDIMRKHVDKVGYTKCGFRYKAKATRASGDQDTLVGNGIANTCLNLWAWCKATGRELPPPSNPLDEQTVREIVARLHDESTYDVDVYMPSDVDLRIFDVQSSCRDALVTKKKELLDDVLHDFGFGTVEKSCIYIEHCGDDNLMAYEKHYDMQLQSAFINTLGMVNNMKETEQPEICSSLFWPTIVNGVNVSVLGPKPGRISVKLGFLNRPIGKLVYSELAGKVYGALKDSHHVPFLSSLLAKYLELLPEGLESKVLYHKYKAHVVDFRPVTERGIEYFCNRYCIAREEYDDLVGGLATIKSLPWNYRHRVFDKMYEIDNDCEF